MNQTSTNNHQNLKINLLCLIVFFLLLMELGRFFDISFLAHGNSQESLQAKIEDNLNERLPNLVSKQIALQIQELVWDKIKLEGQIKTAESKLNEPTVLKVGDSIVKKNEFNRRFQEYQSRSEISKLTRTEQKKRFLEQIHKHYAILEATRKSGLDKQPEFIKQLQDFEFKVFLTELLRQQIKPIDLQDVKSYYEENKSLFELDIVHNFEFIVSDKASNLQKISSPKKFDGSSLEKKKYLNQSENKIPVPFLKVLRSISPNALTAVLPFEGRYYLIKKISDSVKVHSPLKNVAPFIQATLTFQRIRKLLSKLCNPLKFEFDVELNSEGIYKIKNENVRPRFMKLARKVLPKEFFSKAEESQNELRDLTMEFDVLFRNYKQSPGTYPESVRREVNFKSQAYREQLVIDFKRKELSLQAKVSDSDTKAYYEMHKDKFVKSLGRWVSHIFIKERSKALKILNLVLDDPKGFSQLATEHSEHPVTRLHGGDMRYLDKNEVTQQMHAVADTLKEGEVHPELIKGLSGNGYHILRFVKTVPGKVSSYIEVKERLHQLLLKDQQNKLLVAFVNEVMKKYPAKIDDTLLAQL